MTAAARKKGLPALKVANAKGIAHSTVYYIARPLNSTEQQIVARIHRLRRKLPAADRRKMVKLLAADDLPISQGHTARIMRKHNLGSIRVTGGCTRRNRRAGRAPNLLDNRVPQAPNECWADDLTIVFGLVRGSRLLWTEIATRRHALRSQIHLTGHDPRRACGPSRHDREQNCSSGGIQRLRGGPVSRRSTRVAGAIRS